MTTSKHRAPEVSGAPDLDDAPAPAIVLGGAQPAGPPFASVSGAHRIVARLLAVPWRGPSTDALMKWTRGDD